MARGSASRSVPASFVNGGLDCRTGMTSSLNASTKISSSGLLIWTNDLVAAIVRSRLLCILPLLSMRRPTVTGASSLAKKLIVGGALSSKTVNASLERSVTYRPFRSLTVACSTTSSEVVEKIGFCGGAAVNRADQPPVGQWAVTTDDIARAITGHRRGMASSKTETSERGGSSRGARPRDLRSCAGTVTGPSGSYLMNP